MEAADPPPPNRCNYMGLRTRKPLGEIIVFHITVDRFPDERQEDKTGFELQISNHSADVICCIFHYGRRVLKIKSLGQSGCHFHSEINTHES